MSGSSNRLSISGFLRADENEEKIQRVMISEGVSIQVARNLLKAGKLGVGPAAKIAQGGQPAENKRFRDEWKKDVPSEPSRDRHKPPPKPDKKAAAQAMAEKLKKLEEEQEEQELLAEKAKKDQLAKKRAGMISLGPVSTRSEQVDPFKLKEKAELAKREEEERSKKEEEQGRKELKFQEPGPRNSAGITFAPLAARPDKPDPAKVKAAAEAARREEQLKAEEEAADDAKYGRNNEKRLPTPAEVEERLRQSKKRRKLLDKQFQDRGAQSDG